MNYYKESLEKIIESGHPPIEHFGVKLIVIKWHVVVIGAPTVSAIKENLLLLQIGKKPFWTGPISTSKLHIMTHRPGESPIDHFRFWSGPAAILLCTRKQMHSPNRVKKEYYYQTYEGTGHVRNCVDQ